jgi:hypothetical protein
MATIIVIKYMTSILVYYQYTYQMCVKILKICVKKVLRFSLGYDSLERSIQQAAIGTSA